MGRKIIESLWINLKPQKEDVKVLKYLETKKNNYITYLWKLINDETHSYREKYDENSLSFIRDWHLVFNFIFENDVYKDFDINNNILNNIDSDLKWEDSLTEDKFNKYNGFILRKINFNNEFNIYEISSSKRTYKQIQTHFVFVDSFVDLEIFNYYELKFQKQILLLENKNIYIERYVLKEHKLIFKELNVTNAQDKEYFKNFNIWKKKIVNEYSMSPIKFLKFAYLGMFTNKNNFQEVMDELKEIINDFKINFLEEYFFLLLVSLKHSHPKIIEENEIFFNKKNPLFYEFWTKNNRGRNPLTIYEKEVIYWFLEFCKFEESFYREKRFKNKNNLLFSKELNKEKKYFSTEKEIERQFNDGLFDNDFNSGYNEMEIFKKGNKISNKENWDILDSWDSIIPKKNFIDGVNINLKKDYFINKKCVDKFNSFQKILRNKLSVLMAPAGYGKSFLAGIIIKEINLMGETIVFLGPTIKSSRILEYLSDENLNFKSYTLQKVTDKKNPSNSLILNNIENIIIDEFSMISDSIWKEILPLIKNKKRIIIMGDTYQIHSFQGKGFCDYIMSFKNSSKEINFEKLSNNFRQKEEIKEVVEKFRESNDFNSFIRNDLIRKYKDFNEISRIIKDFQEFDVLLTPINYGLYGVKNLLKLFRKDNDFNPKKNVIIIDEYINKISYKLYKGLELTIDKIENDVIYFEAINSFKKEFIPKTNGWSLKKGTGVLEFDLSQVDDIPFILKDVITFHQSQGSTFLKTIIVIPPKYSQNDFDNLHKMIYTAISRSVEDFKILIWEGDIENLLNKK